MIKNLLKELVLPSFWLVFFIFSKTEVKKPLPQKLKAGNIVQENRVMDGASANADGLINIVYLPE